MSTLPKSVSRCQPANCKQKTDCARHMAGSNGQRWIDASTCIKAGGWCALFIDRRAPRALIKAAVLA